MRNSILLIAYMAIYTGCATPTRLQVTPLGQEPAESVENYIYALPRSVLKIEVICREVTRIPGPYADYADRYLGISEVIKQRSSRWRIGDILISHHTEMDPQQVYSLSLLQGEFSNSFFDSQIERGNIVNLSVLVSEEIKGAELEPNNEYDYLRYLDLGVYGNFEQRTETMYKTLVTDTSFVKVPVERTIIEQKSPARKAEEAAEFILDLRTARFELLSGVYEVYPDGEAMGASIEKLDELENSYLALFTGKTITRIQKRTYIIVPGSGTSPSTYRLDMFSAQLGFVPVELMEGEPLEVRISPLGNTKNLESYSSGATEGQNVNKWYYRVPDVVELSVLLGGDLLSGQRISLYQSGAVIAAPVKW